MIVFWAVDKGTELKKLFDSFEGNPDIKLHISPDIPSAKQGDVVLALGSEPQKKLAANGIVAKNRTITSLRGPLFNLPTGGKVMVTYSPSIKNVDWEMYTSFLIDLSVILRYYKTYSLVPELGEYEEVLDFAEFIEQIKEIKNKTGNKARVSLDLETMGLDAYDPSKKIVLITLSHTPGTAIGLYVQDNHGELTQLQKDQLKWLLNNNDCYIVGANLKFDMIWILVKYKLKCTNYKFDTLLAGSLLDENRSNSLKVHAYLYSDLGGYSTEFDKKYDKGHMELIPLKDIMTYGCADADATVRVCDAELIELKKDPKLFRFYKTILHPAARAFEIIESAGFLVNMDYYRKFEEEIDAEIHESETIAMRLMGRVVVKWGDKAALSKPNMVYEYLFTSMGLNLKPKLFSDKTKKPSTAKKHLDMFVDNPKAKPFITAYNTHEKARKIKSTYITGFLKHLRNDGRFHPTYFLFNSGKYDDNEAEGGTNCFTGDTLILTNRGYIPVVKVSKGDFVISHTGSIRKVTDVFYNGIKPIYTVYTSNGLILNTTGNHPYLTSHGWVEAKDLKVDDNVITYSVKEEWKIIPEFTDFQISSWGRVFNSKTNNFIGFATKDKWGNLKVTLRYNDSQKIGKDFAVHRLVAKAFIPNPDNLSEVRHINGVSWDNTASNLAWITLKENRADAILKGSMYRIKGTQHKLSQYDISTIRKTSIQEKTNKELAGEYGISLRLVKRIRNDDRFAEKEIGSKKVTFMEDKVVGILQVLTLETYGLTIDIDESHVSGGIVTHNTGRLSATDPAIQTLPKRGELAKRLRKAFIAPPGFKILSFDYSQGELRIIACLANEKNMLKAYRALGDLHCLTGARLAEISLETLLAMEEIDYDRYDKLRYNAKSANFGLVYGMSAEGYRVYSKYNYSRDIPYSQAESERDMFFETYPGLFPWHDAYKYFARKNGFIRSPLGRVRHLPLANSPDSQVRSYELRRAINAPVQATLSDFMLWSTGILHDRYHFEPDGFTPIASVHDQLLFYVEEDRIMERAKQIKEVMENLPFHEVDWEPQLKFIVDCQVGDNMADLHKMKVE